MNVQKPAQSFWNPPAWIVADPRPRGERASRWGGSAQGVAAFVEEVRFAKQQNLKVLMTIVQLDEDYDIPLTRNTRGWNAKPLSRINLARFSRRLQTLLSALKTAGMTVDAVEFGNEDDTSCYDADVPSGHPASPAEIRVWLRGYGAFLMTGASLAHARRNYPDAKIITFGIAHGGDPKESLSEPAEAVAALKAVDGANDLDNAAYHVDGFGTHIYPSPSDPKGAPRRFCARTSGLLAGLDPSGSRSSAFSSRRRSRTNMAKPCRRGLPISSRPPLTWAVACRSVP